jgi:hypothetical protein
MKSIHRWNSLEIAFRSFKQFIFLIYNLQQSFTITCNNMYEKINFYQSVRP